MFHYWSHSTKNKLNFLAEAFAFHKHCEEKEPPEEEVFSYSLEEELSDAWFTATTTDQQANRSKHETTAIFEGLSLRAAQEDSQTDQTAKTQWIFREHINFRTY